MIFAMDFLSREFLSAKVRHGRHSPIAGQADNAPASRQTRSRNQGLFHRSAKAGIVLGKNVQHWFWLQVVRLSTRSVKNTALSKNFSQSKRSKSAGHAIR
jgi:hypothetical protein